MNLKKDVVVVINKKINKINPIEDGLGICRSCSNFDSNNYLNRVQVGTEEYFDAVCNAKFLPCYLVRATLLTCNSFKSSIKKISLLSKLITKMKR